MRIIKKVISFFLLHQRLIASVVSVLLLALLVFLWLLFRQRRIRKWVEALRRAETLPTWALAVQVRKIGELEMAYWDLGKGKPILLVHGIGASKFIWRKVIPLLVEKNHRVIALDLPGFGESRVAPVNAYGLDSQVEALQSFIRALRLERPVLVGSSMGGAISLWLAKKYPDLVGALVLVSPHVESFRIPRSLHHLFKVLKPLNRTLTAKTMEVFVRAVVSRQEFVTPDVVAAYLRPFQENPLTWTAFGASLQLLADRRLHHELGPLHAPCLVLFGSRDRLVRQKGMERLAKAMDCRLVIHKTGGHHLMEDEPDWMAQQILKAVEARKSVPPAPKKPIAPFRPCLPRTPRPVG
ncbi:MAG: hypothetical protein C5B49_03025 [Bdellovibrio sp.]|nr:MAG: hypothetical protein C5B49_03025 [Bdellovibrio sp.]